MHVRELEDEHAEARFVVSEIERLVDEGGSRDEIAVFYRTNAQSRVLEDMLVRYGVGYQVIGGTRFYERAEIKDALAYLTLLVNPQDVVCFERVVNSPRRGIGDDSQGRIVGHANTLGESVWDVAAAPEQVPGLAAAAVKAVGRFMSVMERLRERAEGSARGGRPAPGDARRDAATSRRSQAERTIEAQGRLENLEELVGVAREYDATAEEPSLEEFLQQIALFSEQDDLRDDEGIVTLMTLHNAKGLEFPVVFIIGCEDGVFPHCARSRPATSRRSAGSPTSASRAPSASSTSPTRARGRCSATATGTCAAASSTRSRSSSPTATRASPPARPRRPAGTPAAAAPPPRSPRRAPASRSATTWCTPTSATAWSPASSPAASWWCASPPTAPSAS